MNIKQKIILWSATFLAVLGIYGSVHAAPTDFFIQGLKGNGTKCLHIVNSGLVGVAGADCGTGGGGGGGGVGWASTTLDADSIYFTGLNNAGIGTTTPQNKLTVVGNTEIVGAISVDSSGAPPNFLYNFVSRTSSGGFNNFLLEDLNSTGGAAMDISSNVSLFELYANGSTRANTGLDDISNASNISAWAGPLVQYTANSYPIIFATGGFATGNERARILSTGQVGIATTSPSQTLSIQGNTLISGDVTSVANVTATGTLTLSAVTGTQCLHAVNGVVSGMGADCGTAGGEANTGATLGTGKNVYDSKAGVVLNFNSLAAGTNITLSTTSNANTIVINSTASGGSGVGTISTSTTPNAGGLATWTSSGAWPETLGTVATGTVSGTNGITVTAGRSAVGGALAVDCTVASNSAAGCTSAASFSKFNSATTTFSSPFTYTAGTNAVTCSTCNTSNATVSSVATTWPVIGGTITTTGTLSFGGLSTSSPIAAGAQVLYATGVNTLASAATGTIAQSGPITVTANQSVIGSGLTIGCSTCVTAVTATNPIISSGGATPALTFAWAYPYTPVAGGNATTTVIGFYNGIYTTNNSSSTIRYASTTSLTASVSADIPRLSNLGTNGFVKTGSSNGTLSVDTATYLTTAVTSVATNNGLTGGTITTTGTLGLDLTKLPVNNLILTYNGTQLQATGTTNLTAGYFTATNTTASILPYATTTAISSSGQATFATGGANSGFGTTTPFWSLQVASNTPYLAITDADAAVNSKHGLISFLDGSFNFGTSSDLLTGTSTVITFATNGAGHVYASTTAPTLSSGVVDGTDAYGRVTGCSSACTVTFATPYAHIPSCVVVPETGSVANTFTYTLSATVITVTETGLAAFNYSCHGQ